VVCGRATSGKTGVREYRIPPRSVRWTICDDERFSRERWEMIWPLLLHSCMQFRGNLDMVHQAERKMRAMEGSLGVDIVYAEEQVIPRSQ